VRPELPFVVEDQRGAPDRSQILQTLLQEHGEAIQVWAEGPAAQEIAGARDRRCLEPGTDLVIWTIPPGPAELRAALDRVRPQWVHLLTEEASAQTPSDFLRGLARAVQYVLSHQRGHTSLVELAAMTAHREATVRQGLDLLAARGRLTCRESGGQLHIDASGGKPTGEGTSGDLKRLLQETAAYRRYFTHASPKDLLQMGE